MAGFWTPRRSLARPHPLVAWCKGIDLATLRGPVALIEWRRPGASFAILTGPSRLCRRHRALSAHGADACDGGGRHGAARPAVRPNLRLYRTDEVRGAELGGAIRNGIAIAAGTVIGAGLGDSARAALMIRSYAEMVRLAGALGTGADTLAGLSGLGDLVLTCKSPQSRNFRFRCSVGRSEGFARLFPSKALPPPARCGGWSGGLWIEMPVTAMVDALASGRITRNDAIYQPMRRPLKQE